MIKFYADANGKFLGVFADGAIPTEPEYIEISTPPSDGKDIWLGGEWVKPPTSIDPRDYNLTPSQFTWLLAVSSLDDVTDTVLAYAKANNRPQYADLKMALSRKAFHFDVTMGLISDMAAAIPAGVDVSPETIAGLWMQAKEKR
jgi:hypothetical protein